MKGLVITMEMQDKTLLEFIRAESKRNWDNSAGLKWKDLTDEQKLQILNLRESNIIEVKAIQGEYVFVKEV